MSNRISALLFAALVACQVSPAQQTRRDAGSYAGTAAVGYSTFDILSTGATRILDSADDDSLQVPLGFRFSFYGNTYDKVCISTNGVLSFGACVESPVNEDLTAYAPAGDPPMIAAYWADLSFNRPDADAVYYLTQGAAGKHRFIVQWNQAGLCCTAGRTVTFQAVLSEETGDIAVNYAGLASADTALGRGLTATIGIRDARGQTSGAVTQWSHKARALEDLMSVQFSRPPRALWPAATAASNAAGYQPEIASGAWFSIYGTLLSATARQWTLDDFTGAAHDRLPLGLDGVSVTVNGKPAPVWFISPGQINAVVPDDDATGDVPVQVSNSQGVSAFTARKALYSPAFFLYAGTTIPIVQPADYSSLLGPTDVLGTVVTRAARPGETVNLWGTGFGPTSPATSALALASPALLAQTPTILIGGSQAKVTYAGLAGPGLCQIQIVIPVGLTGSLPLVAKVGGASSPAGVTITVEP